jgi:hypothetical protein
LLKLSFNRKIIQYIEEKSDDFVRVIWESRGNVRLDSHTAKKAILILFCLFQFDPFSLFPAVQLHSFTDMVKPKTLVIDNGRLFIADQNSVFVYDLKSFQLIRRLGRKGEGPQEFAFTPAISITDDGIYLFGAGKTTVYDKKLNFLKEIKVKSINRTPIFIKDRLVIQDERIVDNKDRYVYSICDWAESKYREFITEPVPPRAAIDMISPFPLITGYRDRVYFSRPDKNLRIEVYDREGKKLYTIQKDLGVIKGREIHRKRQFEFICSMVSRRILPRVTREMKTRPMPKYLPSLSDFKVIDNRIYVKTYDMTENMDKYVILDLQGNIQKTIFLPKVFDRNYTFHDDHFYYLKDTDEDYVLCAEVIT